MDRNDQTAAGAMDYAWQCMACASANGVGRADCARCGCPASATLREIEQHRAQFAAPLQAPREEAVDRSALEAALAASRYRIWYRAALGAFVFSLLIPKGAGLYMLALGFLGAQYSLGLLRTGPDVCPAGRFDRRVFAASVLALGAVGPSAHRRHGALSRGHAPGWKILTLIRQAHDGTTDSKSSAELSPQDAGLLRTQGTLAWGLA